MDKNLKSSKEQPYFYTLVGPPCKGKRVRGIIEAEPGFRLLLRTLILKGGGSNA